MSSIQDILCMHWQRKYDHAKSYFTVDSSVCKELANSVSSCKNTRFLQLCKHSCKQIYILREDIVLLVPWNGVISIAALPSCCRCFGSSLRETTDVGVKWEAAYIAGLKTPVIMSEGRIDGLPSSVTSSRLTPDLLITSTVPLCRVPFHVPSSVPVYHSWFVA